MPEVHKQERALVALAREYQRVRVAEELAPNLRMRSMYEIGYALAEAACDLLPLERPADQPPDTAGYYWMEQAGQPAEPVRIFWDATLGVFRMLLHGMGDDCPLPPAGTASWQRAHPPAEFWDGHAPIPPEAVQMGEVGP